MALTGSQATIIDEFFGAAIKGIAFKHCKRLHRKTATPDKLASSIPIMNAWLGGAVSTYEARVAYMDSTEDAQIGDKTQKYSDLFSRIILYNRFIKGDLTRDEYLFEWWKQIEAAHHPDTAVLPDAIEDDHVLVHIAGVLADHGPNMLEPSKKEKEHKFAIAGLSHFLTKQEDQNCAKAAIPARIEAMALKIAV